MEDKAGEVTWDLLLCIREGMLDSALVLLPYGVFLSGPLVNVPRAQRISSCSICWLYHILIACSLACVFSEQGYHLYLSDLTVGHLAVSSTLVRYSVKESLISHLRESSRNFCTV